MPVVTNIAEAKAQLSKLVERAERGETIIIGRNDRPVAMLVPYEEVKLPRPLGGLKGQIWIAPDFDECDGEIQRMFEESGVESAP